MNQSDTNTLPLIVSEVAEQLRVSRGTVYALLAAKKIRHERVGLGRGKILVRPDALADYLRQVAVPMHVSTQ